MFPAGSSSAPIFSNPEKSKARAITLTTLTQEKELSKRELVTLLQANRQTPHALDFMDAFPDPQSSSARAVLIWYLHEFVIRETAVPKSHPDCTHVSPLPTLDVKARLRELHEDLDRVSSRPGGIKDSHKRLLENGIRQIYGKPSTEFSFSPQTSPEKSNISLHTANAFFK